MSSDLTFQQLIDQGWRERWAPEGTSEYKSLTFYLVDENGNGVTSVEGFGKTKGDAQREAIAKANRWLSEQPQ